MVVRRRVVRRCLNKLGVGGFFGCLMDNLRNWKPGKKKKSHTNLRVGWQCELVCVVVFSVSLLTLIYIIFYCM